jgi:hypothetical protein
MKSRLPATVPSGVNTSITSRALAGTVAAIGTVKIVFEAVFGTLTVAVPIWVNEPGNPVGKGWLLVCRRTVIGCVPPAPVACSIPKETEVTL